MLSILRKGLYKALVTTTFDQAEDILRYCAAQTDVSLIVLIDVTGGTLRARGAMMAATQTSSAGYISNGCVDADIFARARAGETGHFIYGEGSPYRDISLPCGGRLDIAIFQNPDPKILEVARIDLEARRETELTLGEITLRLKPRLKLRIAGRGAACLALAEQAKSSGFEVHIQSPEANIMPQAEPLIDPERPPMMSDDKWTAMVCLFHDHDWETVLLQQALDGPAFYIGAMGSTRTHDTRCQTLRDRGVKQDKIDLIKGPIGLIPTQRDARLLAISILAEIVQTAQGQGLL